MFYSCVKSEESHKYTTVVFISHHNTVPEAAACRKICYDRGATYSAITGWFMTGYCFCGDVPTDRNDKCSCTDEIDRELPTGATGCGQLVYIRGAQSVEDSIITLRALRPFSTSENASVEINAKISFDYYLWTTSPRNGIKTEIPELVNNFYYPERYNVSVLGVSRDRKSKPMKFKLNVLDPVDVELENAEIYADVDKTLPITAIVRQGTDFIATWTYTDNSSQTNPGILNITNPLIYVPR